MATNFDSRQSEYRGILQQLFPYATVTTLDLLLQSIDSDLTSPLKVDAANPASLVLSVGPAIVSNPESNRQRSISFINNLLPAFSSGTVTFPSSSGGNITTSTGGSTVLTVPSNQYIKVLLYMDQTGHILTVTGAPNVAEANALVPPPIPSTLAFAYVSIFNNAGTIQNIAQNKVFQFVGGGSSGSNFPWIAKQAPLTNGSTSLSVTFLPPQPDTSYVVLGMMGNTTDAFPQYQQVEITNKTVNGFTFTWNHPLDSGNYFLSYIVPPKTLPAAEVAIGAGATSLAATLPIAQGGSGYGVIAELQNTVDANPQFQAIVIGSNTSNTVNLEWNVATDSVNYKGVYVIGAVGQVAIPNSATSVTVSLPVNPGTPNFGIVASIQNTTDVNPQFQPMIISAASSGSVTFSWNIPRDTGNYLLNYYAISLTN